MKIAKTKNMYLLINKCFYFLALKFYVVVYKYMCQKCIKNVYFYLSDFQLI